MKSGKGRRGRFRVGSRSVLSLQEGVSSFLPRSKKKRRRLEIRTTSFGEARLSQFNHMSMPVIFIFMPNGTLEAINMPL